MDCSEAGPSMKGAELNIFCNDNGTEARRPINISFLIRIMVAVMIMMVMMLMVMVMMFWMMMVVTAF